MRCRMRLRQWACYGPQTIEMRLRQWACYGPQTIEYIFTPESCDSETALAIAHAFYGRGAIGSVKDEGVFAQDPPLIDWTKGRAA